MPIPTRSPHRPGEPRERVSRGEGKDQCDGYDDDTDECGVAQPSDEAGLGEQKRQMIPEWGLALKRRGLFSIV